MLDRRTRLAAWIAVFALMSGLAGTVWPQERASETRSSSSESEVDDELLEFLGSIDSEDDGLMEYLSRTDAVTVAKRRRAPRRDVEDD